MYYYIGILGLRKVSNWEMEINGEIIGQKNSWLSPLKKFPKSCMHSGLNHVGKVWEMTQEHNTMKDDSANNTMIYK